LNQTARNNVSAAAASGGIAGAAVVIVTWGLGLANIVVPAEVAAAMMVIAAPIIHLIAQRLGLEVPAPEPAPANPPAAQ
jgi:hypothetical protein